MPQMESLDVAVDDVMVFVYFSWIYAYTMPSRVRASRADLVDPICDSASYASQRLDFQVHRHGFIEDAKGERLGQG